MIEVELPHQELSLIYPQTTHSQSPLKFALIGVFFPKASIKKGIALPKPRFFLSCSHYFFSLLMEMSQPP